MSMLDIKGATGPHILLALVRGNDMAELYQAAVSQARALYGADKHLRVGMAVYVTTSTRQALGAFEAEVPVECVDYRGWEGKKLPVTTREVPPELAPATVEGARL